MCTILIGGHEAECLTLMLHGRSHSGAADYWDGNWLDCTADAVVGTFTGRLRRALRTDELERFANEVRQLNERLTGEAALESMEHWLSVRLTGDGRGHIEARCRLCDDPAFGNSLDFRLG